MIDVLLSIRPVWCRKIFRHEKLVELRKSSPRIAAPFRVYLYETKEGRGAVVGECTCWFVEKAVQRSYSPVILESSCLSFEQINEYGKGKTVYGWYLAKVTEYKDLRPLSDFGVQRAPQSWCYVKAA